MEPALSPQSSSSNSNERTLKIAGLALLGCVALCGVVGTCLLAASLLWPLFAASAGG